MARVMIRCPVTGNPVPTGMNVTSLDGVTMRDNVLGNCPECGRDHVWSGEDAFLEDD
jgi:hypothetical protein